MKYKIKMRYKQNQKAFIHTEGTQNKPTKSFQITQNTANDTNFIQLTQSLANFGRLILRALT